MPLLKQISIIAALSILCFVTSCGKTIRDYAAKGEFRYYNRLSTPIQIEIRQGIVAQHMVYNIPPGDAITLATTGETIEKTTEASGYVPGILSDTTTVKFNDTTCYVEYRNGSLLHKIDNYKSTRKGDREFLFHFDIDSSLYKQAKRCQ